MQVMSETLCKTKSTNFSSQHPPYMISEMQGQATVYNYCNKLYKPTIKNMHFQQLNSHLAAFETKAANNVAEEQMAKSKVSAKENGRRKKKALPARHFLEKSTAASHFFIYNWLSNPGMNILCEISGIAHHLYELKKIQQSTDN